MSVLNQEVLVLDKNLQPHGTSSVKEIIGLVCIEKAKVIDSDYNLHTLEDWIIYSKLYVEETGDSSELFIHSPSVRFLVPRAIVLVEFTKGSSNISEFASFTRTNLFKRDKFTCQYCGDKLSKSVLTIDHIVPKSNGGRNTKCCPNQSSW